MPRRSLCLLLFASTLGLSGNLPAEEIDLDVVRQWLVKHHGATSLHIEFSQTRRMAALKNPLRTQGSMWLDFSNHRFRWQSGDPPKTIVIRDGEQLVIAHPERKRVEYKPASAAGSAGPASLAALAEGFPKTVAEFQGKYRLLSTGSDDQFYRIRTLPIRGPAARGLAQLTFFVDRKEFTLRGYLATLKDGSTVQYDFDRIVRNPDFPDGLFSFESSGYEVVKAGP